MLSDEIKKFFHGDVESDGAILEKYSRDYSLFKVRPQVVVFPKDAEDLKNLVKFASVNEGISLTARSGGTDMTGGPLGESVIVEFDRYFNRIKEISDDFAIVEPGVYFRDFEPALKKKGLLYPPYPASKDICALGGMINNNSGGEKTLAYGKTEDYVEELKVILSDGEEHILRPLQTEELQKKLQEQSFEGGIYRKIYELVEKNYGDVQAAKPDVSKNSSGYALWNVWDKKAFNIQKLFVGAQGTLGFLLEAKLKLVREKKYRRMAVIFLGDFEKLPRLIVEILKFKPESLESYDDRTLSVAMKFLPSMIKSMGGHFFKLVWQFLPEAIMVLRGGLPKMIILAELNSDDKPELDMRMEALRKIVLSFGLRVRVLKDESEEEKYWTIRRQSFKLLHDHSTGKDTAPFIDDVIVRPAHLPEFLPQVNAILDEYKDRIIYTIAGHPGDGNFHIIPLMDLRKPDVRAIIPEISERIYDLVVKYRGSITAEHNDGLIRTPYLGKIYNPKILNFFAEVKKVFDPKNIFNPGKKVGGSLKYSLGHIQSVE